MCPGRGHASIYLDAGEGRIAALVSSVKCPQLCWISFALCVSRPAPLIHLCSAFNFVFGRNMCGLFWNLVKNIHRPWRGKTRANMGGGTGKKKAGKEGSGKRNSITSLHCLYIVCWRFLEKSHALCITFCLWMPFLLCAFNNFILIFLSSLLLEAAWLPLCCSIHALLLLSLACHLYVQCHGQSHLVTHVSSLDLSELQLSPSW